MLNQDPACSVASISDRFSTILKIFPDRRETRFIKYIYPMSNNMFLFATSNNDEWPHLITCDYVII